MGEWIESSTGLIINDSHAPTDAVMSAITDQHPELAALVRWSRDQSSGRSGSIFERDRYVTPENPYEQMRVAYHAAQSDDIVAGALEICESLAFSSIDFESEDEDEEDIWNQWSEEIDLQARMREMWRETAISSQFYATVFYGKRTYRVRGKSRDGGVKRKRVYDLRVPIGISLIDPLKVVPVGNMLFNQERLAYIASRAETESFSDVLAGYNTSDLAVLQMIERKYEASAAERLYLGELGIDPENLFLLNDKFVWRYTETRPQYERFANIRMRSVFELLDLKQQLRSADRAALLGATNYILLVKKGTDDLPAKPAEITALSAQIRGASRIPIIVGDHRLEIEIITPKNDNTLMPERYNALDARITARMFGILMSGNYSAGTRGDDSIKLSKVIGRNLENRRNSLTKFLQKHVINPTQELNESLRGWAEIRFHPKRIALDFDPALAQILQQLRDRGDVSRESLLDELGFDQGDEARKREKESVLYDDIFTPTNVPFDSPVKTGTPDSNGRNGGGNRNGGGRNVNSEVPNSTPVSSSSKDIDE